jgi:hypothetical protein
MTVRVVSKISIIPLLRTVGISLAAIIGAWDVARLLSSGDREPSAFDLATSPIIPVMRLLGGAMFSDGILAVTLFVGNAATYGLLAYGILRLVDRRNSLWPLKAKGRTAEHTRSEPVVGA